MAADFEQAVETLYRAPHESFVAERQRLAAELKGKGDKAQAARVAKLGRPTLSAWAVNQLWWHARSDFERLFETAQQLRQGKHSASAAHRDALAKLMTRAKQQLHAGEHGTADATLRRINMTLAGLAAAGSFDPELPGALTKDRDPPGFEAFGISAFSETDEETETEVTQAEAKPEKPIKHDAAERKRHDEAAAKGQREKERAAAESERQRVAEEKARRAAQRREAESTVREAKAALSKHEHEHARVAKELRAAEHEVELARTALEKAERGFSALQE